jgi:hypothetical protein
VCAPTRASADHPPSSTGESSANLTFGSASPDAAGLFELFGDFVEPGLDAWLVDAGRQVSAVPEPSRTAIEIAIIPVAMPAIASPGALLAVVLLTDNNRFSLAEESLTAVLTAAVLVVVLILRFWRPAFSAISARPASWSSPRSWDWCSPPTQCNRCWMAWSRCSAAPAIEPTDHRRRGP